MNMLPEVMGGAVCCCEVGRPVSQPEVEVWVGAAMKRLVGLVPGVLAATLPKPEAEPKPVLPIVALGAVLMAEKLDCCPNPLEGLLWVEKRAPMFAWLMERLWLGLAGFWAKIEGVGASPKMLLVCG